MNSPTKEQLSDLTEALNQRLEEFEIVAMPTITVGIMRQAYDVIQAWMQEHAGDSWRELDIAPPAPPAMVSRMPVMVAPVTAHEPAYGNGRHADELELSTASVVTLGAAHTGGNGHHHAALSPSAIATLGPEHTTVTPLKGRGGNVLPSLPELVAEVRRLSMGGTMPTMAVFDEARPATWATAAAHLNRLGLTWETLAEAAGLKLVRRGQKSDE